MMRTVFNLFLLIVLQSLHIFVGGKIVSMIWNTFIVPLGASEISLIIGSGIILLVSFLTSKLTIPTDEKTQEQLTEELFLKIMFFLTVCVSVMCWFLILKALL